jgi:hypothetical protein
VAPPRRENSGAQAVEDLRKATLTADKAKLAALTASELSYGHSDMWVQKQTEFINGVVKPQDDCQTARVSRAEDCGGRRRRGRATTSRRSTPTAKYRHQDRHAAVWQKQGEAWKLLAP